MEVALTPLEFARRTRRLHGHREGVVDDDLRLSYEEFFDRCDRWSTALQAMGDGWFHTGDAAVVHPCC
jgi:fatty-acyl-CoA synthase